MWWWTRAQHERVSCTCHFASTQKAAPIHPYLISEQISLFSSLVFDTQRHHIPFDDLTPFRSACYRWRPPMPRRSLSTSTSL